MDRSPGFGSNHIDYAPISDSVSLRLPYSVKLANASNSLTHYTKGTQSQNISCMSAPTACMHTVSGSISLPSLGFFSPFPHGTGSLSVSREYLALEDGPPIFNQDFSCPDLLFVNTTYLDFQIRGYHPLLLAFPNHSLKTTKLVMTGLFPVRSPLLGKSRLISFPLGTEMFQFSRFAS